ncbi:hypothetical protein RUM44_006557 [Polyplax serrata]|uniref:Uracil-DNA glycosylase-like domain-containing protein n=1 Tax=Polyplax serrata TaxID=468196 RepID=A0ABR1AIF9_POLSC
MKQEAANDDGYETGGVDHFEIRTHSQGDQGKMNQNVMEQQHMQSMTQMQHMHHPHQQHHHGVQLDHRLLLRRPQENHIGQENHRISSSVDSHLDNRLSNAHTAHDGNMNIRQADRDAHINQMDGRLSEDTTGHEGRLSSIEARLGDHEGQVSNMESSINSMSGNMQSHEVRVSGSVGGHDGRILSQENQTSSVGTRMTTHDSRMGPVEGPMGHENHMRGNENHENRLGNGDSQMGNHENHLVGMEGRVTQENRMNSMENQMVPHGNHLAGLENRLGHDNMMGNMVKRVGNREIHLNGMNEHDGCMNSLDARLNPHDGHMGGMDGRMLSHENHMLDSRMENRSNHMGVHENRINGLDGRMVGRESHVGHPDSRLHGIGAMDARDGLLNAHGNHMGLHIGHMGSHDHMQPHPHMQNIHHPHHHPHPHHMHHPHHGHHAHSHPHVKCDSMEDPYSFVEDDPTGMGGPPHVTQQPRPSPVMLQSIPKKRGRKKKIKPEDGLGDTVELLKKENGLLKPVKERKKHDRFNGMPEEEVVKRTLPDHLTTNLDIVIIGINPGLFAAYKGHHYAGPGNHFWKCLYLSGLTPEPMTADDDYKLLSVGIGFTNMVARATKGSADLTRKEIKEGSQILLEKLQKFKPKIAVFNGKLIYEVFSGNKDFNFGRQPDFVDGTNTYMWVMPSSSARCAQLPRAADKVPFYAALKKFRDYLNGLIAELDENEVVFNDQKLKTFYESDIKIESKDEQPAYYPYSRMPGNELTDLSNAVVKKEPFDPNRPEKKKRGRPKKIRVEGEETPPKEKVKKEKLPVDGDTPKKKRGRPKKIKSENGMCTEQRMAPQNMGMQNGVLTVSEHTSSSNPASTCFSPPIQSPSGFCQGFSPAYASQAQNTLPQQYNPRAPSPGYHPSPHHPSPLPTQYSQSPPPASQSQSQPFTHSDLSSEISAAISSEHLGSPPPTSPSLGPPDFEPPTSMPEDTAPSSMSVKEEPEQECRFSSPAPSEPNYQYRGFPEPDMEQKAAASQFQRQPSPEFASKRTNQDVASKSLSGLESLVDQIPSIAEGGTGNSSTGPSGEGFDSQHSGQYEDYLGYPGYNSTAASATPPQPGYPHYSSSTNYSTAGYLPPSQSSFSVSSLANSASNHGHESQVASSFSVSSLASNYTPGGYPNLMGAPHLVVPQPGLFPTGMNMPPNYQYPGQYPAGPTSFPYSPHALHVPSPNYPPYGPYSNSSYPQPYLANHVFDRIKQERMDIGFGSF